VRQHIIAAAVAFAVASPAFAQSSVTLYGVIDTGINWTSNAQTASAHSPLGRTGGSQWSMTSGEYRPSRWGLKGTEDLGDGYKGIFTLESGFGVNNGAFQQGGTFLGRQAFVGIDAPWGTVTLGRQYDSLVDVTNVMQGGTAAGSFADHPGDIDNVANNIRVNNSVKFTSKTWRGLYVTGLYGFGGVAGNFGKNSVWSVGTSYSGGPVTLAAGYIHANNPNQSWWGNMANGSSTGNNLSTLTGVITNPIDGGFASARTYQVVGLDGQYDFGRTQIGVNYTNTSFQNLGYAGSGNLALTNPLGYSGTATFNNYMVFARSFVTPTLELGAAYDFLYGGRVNDKPSAHYHQFNLAAIYFLSKGTDVYLAAGFMKASGTDSTGQPAVPYFILATASNKSTQSIVRIGIHTQF